MPKSKRKKLGYFLKLFISLCLFAFVYYKVDSKGLWKALSALSFKTLLTLLLLHASGQILSAIKWRVFLNSANIGADLKSTLRAYFFGMFVNVFGFGTVGGDVARALAVAPPGQGQKAAGLASVLADRVHGLWVLLSIGCLMLAIFHPPEISHYSSLIFLIGIPSIIGIGIAWFLGPKLLEKFLAQTKWNRTLLSALGVFPKDKSKLLFATLISAVFHCIQLGMHIIIARELQANISLGELLATVPFVNIAASLPISAMNGWGVRELMYDTLLVPLGLTHELAIAFGAIWLLVVTLVSSIGVLFVTPKLKEELNETEQETT